ncbi:hypothetical protein ULF88_00085 [Halopseudomonas pachastrellae]|nr:hypothetical protein [Halopseudomonas pachastrellae]
MAGPQGHLDGYLQLGGDSAAPQLASVLRGAGVGLDGLQVESLNLDANTTLNEQLPLNLAVTGQGIRSDDTQLGDLQLTLRGRRAAHELLLSLQNGVADADLALGGALDDTAWRGTLTRRAWLQAVPAVCCRIKPISTIAWAMGGFSYPVIAGSKPLPACVSRPADLDARAQGRPQFE